MQKLKTAITWILVPLFMVFYAIGYVVGLAGRPLYAGFVKGFTTVQDDLQKKLMDELEKRKLIDEEDIEGVEF